MEILVDAYCKSGLCQHPACWDAHRRESRGLLYLTSSVAKRKPEYNALPTQQIVNLFQELEDFGSECTYQAVLSTRKTLHRSSNQTSTRLPIATDTEAKHGDWNRKVVRSMTSPEEEVTKSDEKVQLLPSVVRQVEIHELFDRNDLGSKWQETFAPKSYYVWVPSTQNTGHSGKLKTTPDSKNRSMVVKDLTEGLFTDNIHRTLPPTRSRTCLKSPRFIQDRLKLKEQLRPVTCPSDMTSNNIKPVSSSSDSRQCCNDVTDLSQEFVLFGYSKQNAAEISEGIRDTKKDLEVKTGTPITPAEHVDAKEEHLLKDLKNKTVVTQSLVSGKNNEDVVPRWQSQSGRPAVRQRKYAASPMSSIQIPLVPAVTPSSTPQQWNVKVSAATPASTPPQRSLSPIKQLVYKSAGIPLPSPLNVESESKNQSNATQQKMPSVKTLSFSPAPLFQDKQLTERRHINVSIPLMDPMSRTYQHSEKEVTILRQPSPPPPSPDNQILLSDNRPSYELECPPYSPDNQIIQTYNRPSNETGRHDVAVTDHSNGSADDVRPMSNVANTGHTINDKNDITLSDKCVANRAAQNL